MITAEVTISGEIFDLAAVEKAIIAGVDEVIDLALLDFNATIGTWSSRSRFQFDVKRATRKGDVIEGSVGTDNANYVRINNGTGARPRTAKTAKGMSFRYSYRAKTAKGFITSSGSSRSGRWVSGIRHVKSGAIKAREFDKTIAKSRTPDFIKRTNAAVAQAVK